MTALSTLLPVRLHEPLMSVLKAALSLAFLQFVFQSFPVMVANNGNSVSVPSLFLIALAVGFIAGVIVAGTLIFEAILDALDYDEFFVSDRDLLYGIILSAIVVAPNFFN